jgi:hypothetical protein
MLHGGGILGIGGVKMATQTNKMDKLAGRSVMGSFREAWTAYCERIQAGRAGGDEKYVWVCWQMLTTAKPVSLVCHGHATHDADEIAWALDFSKLAQLAAEAGSPENG